MWLFEDRIESLFTEGPAVVMKVEQRKDPRRSEHQTRGIDWEEYGVVIYTAKSRATPVQRGGSWMMPETAHETRFVRVPDFNGSCQIPEEAGRLLGHYREQGRKWWVFLEKLGAAPSLPAPDARQKSAAVSPPAKAGPAAPARAPAKPSAPQASRPPDSPGSTSAPRQP
jgi:hypothetical protein